jgi:hypothetical protein
MRGPTCIFWTNLTPFSLKVASIAGTVRSIVAEKGLRGLYQPWAVTPFPRAPLYFL